MITEPGLYWILTKGGWQGHAKVIDQEGELLLHLQMMGETRPLEQVNKILQESRRVG